MKKLLSFILVIASLLLVFCSCGGPKMTNTDLFDICESNILGMTKDEILKLDKHNADYQVKEKKQNDGTIRVKYMISNLGDEGDIFVNNGNNWLTTVDFYFRDDMLVKYEIEYRQTGYSEGECAKRMNMFEDYFNGKYERASESEKDYTWVIGNGTINMTRQNGGWILFVFE